MSIHQKDEPDLTMLGAMYPDEAASRRQREQDLESVLERISGPEESADLRIQAVGDDPSKSDGANHKYWLREKVVEFIEALTAFDRNNARVALAANRVSATKLAKAEVERDKWITAEAAATNATADARSQIERAKAVCRSILEGRKNTPLVWPPPSWATLEELLAHVGAFVSEIHDEYKGPARPRCPECDGDLGGVEIGRLEDHRPGCSRTPL